MKEIGLWMRKISCHSLYRYSIRQPIMLRFLLEAEKNAYKDLYKEFSSIVPVSYGAEALKGLSKGQLEKRFLHDMISICRKSGPK